MLTTFCRENDRAQASAGLQSIETRFQTAVQLETSPVINPEVRNKLAPAVVMKLWWVREYCFEIELRQRMSGIQANSDI